MASLLWFLAGLLIGGCIGTVVLCCVQINRANRYECEIRQLRNQLYQRK